MTRPGHAPLSQVRAGAPSSARGRSARLDLCGPQALRSPQHPAVRTTPACQPVCRTAVQV